MSLKIDALFWDIGGVILDIQSARRAQRQFLKQLSKQVEFQYDTEKALQLWREKVGQHFHDRTGTEFRKARNGYRKATEAIITSELTEDWYEQFLMVQRKTLSPNPGAVSTIKSLDDQHQLHHMCIISDIDRSEGTCILRTFEITNCFDSVTISEDVGVTKPGSIIFEAALNNVDIDTEHTAIVGDRVSHDIKRGNNIGMQTILYTQEPPDDYEPAPDYQIQQLSEIKQFV